MWDPDDGHDIVFDDIENQVRSLALASIAFAYFVANPARSRVVAEPHEARFHVGQVFFRLTLAPMGKCIIRDLV
jgi:hypothetical protein